MLVAGVEFVWGEQLPASETISNWLHGESVASSLMVALESGLKMNHVELVAFADSGLHTKA